jgi:hypothetical protein
MAMLKKQGDFPACYVGLPEGWGRWGLEIA